MSVNSVEKYLKAPYSRVLIPDPETGTYTAQILEFPGCVSQGDSPEDAYKNLEDAAKGWIQAALDQGQSIPEPVAYNQYGGKLLVRLPKSLHRDLAHAAERDGVSVNQYVIVAIAEKVRASTIQSSLSTIRQALESYLPVSYKSAVANFYWSDFVFDRDMFARTAITTETDMVIPIGRETKRSSNQALTRYMGREEWPK